MESQDPAWGLIFRFDLIFRAPLEERLARLEGRVEEISKRIDDLRWFFYITWALRGAY